MRYREGGKGKRQKTKGMGRDGREEERSKGVEFNKNNKGGYLEGKGRSRN